MLRIADFRMSDIKVTDAVTVSVVELSSLTRDGLQSFDRFRTCFAQTDVVLVSLRLKTLEIL
jgi:hypothetical protein